MGAISINSVTGLFLLKLNRGNGVNFKSFYFYVKQKDWIGFQARLILSLRYRPSIIPKLFILNSNPPLTWPPRKCVVVVAIVPVLWQPYPGRTFPNVILGPHHNTGLHLPLSEVLSLAFQIWVPSAHGNVDTARSVAGPVEVVLGFQPQFWLGKRTMFLKSFIKSQHSTRHMMFHLKDNWTCEMSQPKTDIDFKLVSSIDYQKTTKTHVIAPQCFIRSLDVCQLEIWNQSKPNISNICMTSCIKQLYYKSK